MITAAVRRPVVSLAAALSVTLAFGLVALSDADARWKGPYPPGTGCTGPDGATLYHGDSIVYKGIRYDCKNGQLCWDAGDGEGYGCKDSPLVTRWQPRGG